MEQEVKFAKNVMLIDAAYLDRVAKDLSKHFGEALGRKLQKADLPVLLECLALDAGLRMGENAIQVLFIYDKESKIMKAVQPGNLEKELNDVAFKSQLGEFSFHSFEPSDMTDREELFLESLKLVADAKEVERLLVIPAEGEYDDKVSALINKVNGKEHIAVFTMNPPTEEVSYLWEMLGFAILQSLGIKADEL